MPINLRSSCNEGPHLTLSYASVDSETHLDSVTDQRTLRLTFQDVRFAVSAQVLNDRSRGYYPEYVRIRITPTHNADGYTCIRHGPERVNDESRFTRLGSGGHLHVGISGAGVGWTSRWHRERIYRIHEVYPSCSRGDITKCAEWTWRRPPHSREEFLKEGLLITPRKHLVRMENASKGSIV